MVQVPLEVVQLAEPLLPNTGFAVKTVPSGISPTEVELVLIAPPWTLIVAVLARRVGDAASARAAAVVAGAEADELPRAATLSSLAGSSGDVADEVVLLWLGFADASLLCCDVAGSAWAEEPPKAGTTLRASRAEATTAPPSLRR